MPVKLEWLGYRTVEKLWRYVKPFFHTIPACHGQTDRRTDRITISISRVSSSMLTHDKKIDGHVYPHNCRYLSCWELTRLKGQSSRRLFIGPGLRAYYSRKDRRSQKAQFSFVYKFHVARVTYDSNWGHTHQQYRCSSTKCAITIERLHGHDLSNLIEMYPLTRNVTNAKNFYIMAREIFNLANKLEGTHRVRTHAVLLLTLTLTVTFDLSTPNPCHF